MWKNKYVQYKNKAEWKAILKGLVCVAVFIPLLTSCSILASEEKPVIAQDLEIRSVIEKADPQGAIDEIYASLDEYSSEKLTGIRMEETTGLSIADLDEAYIYYSDVNHGLADIFIVKPKSGAQPGKPQSTIKDKVREALYDYKIKRTQEFVDYDILSSLSISEGAVIYDQGDYIIMLMLRDNDAAKAVIDIYIPQ